MSASPTNSRQDREHNDPEPLQKGEEGVASLVVLIQAGLRG
jgi:hypothetical protein